MTWRLPGTTPPLPSSTLIRPPPVYMTITTTSKIYHLIVSCLASARAAAVGAAVAVAAGVIVVKFLIMTIEHEGSKPSLDALGQCNSAAQSDGLCRVCHGSPGGGSKRILVFVCHQSWQKTMHQSTSTAGDEEVGGRSRRQQIKRNGGPGRWGGGGAMRGEGGDATTGQGRQQETAARWQVEAPADRRPRHDKMQCTNQPGMMRDNHTREQGRHDRVQGLRRWEEEWTLLKEEGGSWKEDGTGQKEDSMAAGGNSVNDGSGGQRSGQRTAQQGRMQQPPMNGSSRGKQWLATMRVRGQRLAMVEKGGSSQRRAGCGQRGVIAALEAAEASWIWRTKMHAAEGGCKQEDGSIF